MKKVLYYIMFLLWYLVSLLPLRLLYFFSDLLYYPLYHCLRYRRKVVRTNLRNAFPEKDGKELRRIEKDFYCFFCDYMVETVKLFSMGKEQLKRRMTFSGLEEIDRLLEEKSIIVYIGHYGNWEWIASLPLHLHLSDTILAGQIYHKLENWAFDKLFYDMRSRFGGFNMEMFTALRKLLRLKQENKHYIVGFIADQSPNWDFVKMWTSFLNQRTSFFMGAESLSKATDSAVFYLDVQRVKRGYYHGTFIRMTNHPKEYPEYMLTVEYARRLEETIRRAPQYWLWSHKRWKRSWEKYCKNKQIDPSQSEQVWQEISR